MSIGKIDKVSTFCNIQHMNNEIGSRFDEAARMLRVLGHPMRLAMVEALRAKTWCVCELASYLGLNKSTASKHLSQLEQVGVISMDREGTRVNCSLIMPCIFDMMSCARISRPGTDGNETCGSTGCCPDKSKKESL